MKPETCVGCSLEKIGTGWVPLDWNPSKFSGVMVIGEGAGASEAADGLPFRPYAASGSLLADAMREVGMQRSEIAVANVISCHTPSDWLIGAPWEFSSIGHCTTNNLSRFIQEVKPKVILAVGNVAQSQLTVRPKGRHGQLESIRGYVTKGAGVADGIPVISTFHPSFLKRGASHLIPLFQRDLRRALNIALGRMKEGIHFSLDPLSLGLKYQTSPSLSEAWEYERQLDPTLPLAFDCETPMTTREDESDRTSFTTRDIKLFQCTQRRGEGIAIPFRDQYIEVIKAILAKCPIKVGFNNWNFDDPVFAANGIDVGPTHDAMVMFHCYNPDLPANLQTVAQFCGFLFNWKHFGDEDLAWYGVCDVDATLCVFQTMRVLLEREGLWEGYEHLFHTFHPILRKMADRGLPISDAKRLELKDTVEREGKRIDEEIKALVPVEVLGGKQKKGLKNPPKLKCGDCNYEGREDHFCKKYEEDGFVDGEMVSYAELAEEAGYIYREYTITEDEKCRCKKAERSGCSVCVGTGIIPKGLVEMRWATLVEFNPNSSHQVKRFMKFLKHPIPKHAKRTDPITGESAETTEVKELERLYIKTKHPLYPLLIQKRQLTKVLGTYVIGWEPNKDGRLRTTFTFQTATLQTTSRSPNIQNGLKHGKTVFQKTLAKAFNGMQQAEEGHVMVNIDAKSFHAQTTACEARLPDMLRLAKLDVHSFVTCHYLKLPERIGLYERPDEELKEIFKRLKKDEKFKFTRDYKSKRTFLGIMFSMGPRKLYQLNPDDFDSEKEARVIHDLIMKELFPGLLKWQERMKEEAAEKKFLVNRFGIIRRFYDVRNWDRKRQKWGPGDQAEAAVAFLPASNAFGYMREAMLRMEEKDWNERYSLVNSIHDSLVFHCPKDLMEECINNVTSEISKPNMKLVYPGVAPNGLSVEAEASFGPDLANMSEYKG